MTSKRAVELARERRRMNVAKMLRDGMMVHEIAAQLKVAEDMVRRDVKALRLAAAEHAPWENPPACAAGFVEAAEEALQKVRSAQRDAETTSTAYVNLVKLEWTMLVKFIEMLSPKRTAPPADDAAATAGDFTRLSNAELIAKGRELGVDVTALEHALGAAPATETEADDNEDMDEAA